jgi:hypothetical protein
VHRGIFGEETAGGALEVSRARELLERLHSLEAFRESALAAKR